jgi:O-antigen/teichoic acid export membrane protein
VLYIASAYQSHLQFKMFNVLRAVVPLGALIGAAALAWNDTLTAPHMVLVYTALPFLALGLGVIAARRSSLLNRLSPTRTMASRLLRYGMKAFVGELSNSVNIRLDQILIAIFLPARQLGLYVTAVSASQLAIMVSFSIRTVLQPRLIDEPDHDAKWRLFKRGMWQYTVIGGGISIMLALIVPMAIPWLFGDAFRPAILPTEILIWAVFILGHKTILTGVAQAYGDPWLASRAELVGAVVTIITLLALVPSLGITGASLSSLIAYATQAALILHGLRTIHAT